MSTVKPRFAIVDECDSPCRRNVAEWKEDIGYCYMARAEDEHLKRYDGMNPSRPTPIEDFGFAVLVRDDAATFLQAAPSTATYEDGTQRRWQGESNSFTLPLAKLERRHG